METPTKRMTTPQMDMHGLEQAEFEVLTEFPGRLIKVFLHTEQGIIVMPPHTSICRLIRVRAGARMIIQDNCIWPGPFTFPAGTKVAALVKNNFPSKHVLAHLEVDYQLLSQYPEPKEAQNMAATTERTCDLCGAKVGNDPAQASLGNPKTGKPGLIVDLCDKCHGTVEKVLKPK